MLNLGAVLATPYKLLGKNPLRYSHGQILDLGKTMYVKSDGVEADEQIVLSFVVTFNRVAVCETLESGIRQAFIVVTPTNTFVLEEIDNGRYVLVDKDEAVAVQAEGISTARRNVVRLTWSPDAVIVGQQDTLLDQSLTVRCECR